MVVTIWVCFPDVEFTTGRQPDDPLTDFEKCCIARLYLKTGRTMEDISENFLGGVQISKPVEVWAARWSLVSACLLAKRIAPALLHAHQPHEFDDRYKLPIACLVDGTAMKMQSPRKDSLLAHATFCHKVNTNAVQGILWCTPCGMVLRNTSLFCGRLSEKAMVFLHRKLLNDFPRRFARLVDRGFARCTAAYRNVLPGFYPAFVKNGEIAKDLVSNAAEQSADRYVVEVANSRVKLFKSLSGIARYNAARHLERAWNTGVAATDAMFPLRRPANWLATMQFFSASKAERKERQNVQQWGDGNAPWYSKRHISVEAIE